MTEADKEAQEDEQLVLQSMFDKDNFMSCKEEEDSVIKGTIFAHLNLPQPFQVVLSKNQNEKKHYDIKFLLPIMMEFQIPQDYPSNSPPTFTISCPWLHAIQIRELDQKLDEIWKENVGEVVLFAWTNFLTEEAFTFLKVTTPLDINDVERCKARVDNEPQNSLKLTTGAKPKCHKEIKQGRLLQEILEHNHREIMKEYQFTLFVCDVCFAEKLGSQCTKFYDCDHVFCKECMKGYCEVHIKEGTVKSLTCPSDKCESQVHPDQVKELVTQEEFSRYESLLLQCSLDTMTDIVYCPRKGCGCAVMSDSDTNMGVCSNCNFAFCTICDATYHGVSKCKTLQVETEEGTVNVEDLCEVYTNATPEEKEKMEKKIGKERIQRWLAYNLSEKWVDENCRYCPVCTSKIEKFAGCNKVHCTKCNASFCWLCLTILGKDDPYHHFRSPQSPCHDKLFRRRTWDED